MTVLVDWAISIHFRHKAKNVAVQAMPIKIVLKSPHCLFAFILNRKARIIQ